MSLLIRNARIVEPGKKIAVGDVLVRDGRIAASGQINAKDTQGSKVNEACGRLLTPGLIDVHTHGVKHSLYEAGPEGVRSAARSLGEFGVTTVLPTIIPKVGDSWLDHLRAIAAALPTIKEVNIPCLLYTSDAADE